MIITSLLDNSDYFWVNIPRTGTNSYLRIFEPQTKFGFNIIYHSKYDHKLEIPGFSLVRNPLDKFVSGLKFLSKLALDKKYTAFWKEEYVKNIEDEETIRILNSFEINFDFLKNEKNFYLYVYNSFSKNCIRNNENEFEHKIIPRNSHPYIYYALNAIFRTQVDYAYHPKVKIFKYENIDEYNTWIENTLGYDTSQVKKLRINESTNSIPIDTTTTKFKELVEYLFYDDLKIFGYTL